jgi:hypothetical protein
MRIVQLPPGGNPIAVNKYITSYNILFCNATDITHFNAIANLKLIQ